MTEATLLMLVVAATWGGMYNVIKIVEMKNDIRNRILGIDKDASKIPVKHMKMLLRNDYIPLAIGIWIFLAVFSVSIAAAPWVYQGPPGLLLVVCCIGIAGFGFFAIAIDVWATFEERIIIIRHIDEAAQKESSPSI